MAKKAVKTEPKPGARPKDAPLDVPYYRDVPALAEVHELVDMVEARQANHDKIKELEAVNAEYSAAIGAILQAAQVASVGVDHYKVTLSKGKETRTLTGVALLKQEVEARLVAEAAVKVDAQALLVAGVPATTIERATEVKVGAPYVLVTDARKRGKDAGGER